MADFSQLKLNAEKEWEGLVKSSKPWVRIGSSMCGQAAGAFGVSLAISTQASARNLNINIDQVGCIGLCYLEPIVDVLRPGFSRVFFGNVSDGSIDSIVRYIETGELDHEKGNIIGYLGDEEVEGVSNLNDFKGISLQRRVALKNVGNIVPGDINQYIANGGYQALNDSLEAGKPEDVVKVMQESGLRGRGGAGFPTGLKWSFMVRSPGPVKYILANCEEGDPGAYNDKGILEGDPHMLLEGILLAGYSTGASNGIVFIRHGHDGPIDRTKEAISQAYSSGLLGKNILGYDFDFDIEVSLTGDSYVAGEETALMESIEGKRAMPRFKPPFPAASGLWGKPTTINNVKTLAYAPEIIKHGEGWFSSIGVNRSKGTVIICLNGDINKPGMYEVPFGLTLGDIIHEIGGGIPNGKSLKMLQTGGPLGGVLGKESLDITLDLEEMSQAGAILGSGGIIVADEEKCAVDMTRILVAFCQFESCGKCFPCRLGMVNLLEIVERITRCEAREGDLDLMKDVGQNMQMGSLCAHGQLGFNPIRSAITYFESDFISHIKDSKCPTGSCEKSVYLPKNTRALGEINRENQDKQYIPINNII